MRERILPFTFQRQMPITGGTASRRVLVRVPLTMKLAGILAATFAIGLAAAAEGAQAPSKKAPSARAVPTIASPSACSISHRCGASSR